MKLEADEDYFRPEPLDPELEATLWQGDGFTFVKHPLVNAIYVPPLNRQLNQTLRAKRAEIAKLTAEGRLAAVLVLYERPFRLAAFHDLHEKLPMTVAGNLLLELWEDTELPYQQRRLWLQLFHRYAGISPMMLASRKGLPAQLTIYRGTFAQEVRLPLGLSWTTDLEKARWFARRFNTTGGIVLEGRVRKQDVFACCEGRGEAEVVVDPTYTFNASVKLKETL